MKIIKLLLLALLLALPLNGYAQQSTPYGDVNGDNEVNIADVNTVIGVILDGVAVTPAADVNGDGEINIADVNADIDIILGGGFDPHLLEVCERVSEIDHDIKYYYEECETLEELIEHAAEIEALEGVEYVFFDNNTTMYVKIKDFGTISYSYFPELEISDSTIIQYSKFEHSLKKAIAQTTHSHQDYGGVLIVNQQSKDEGRKLYSDRYDTLLSFLLDCGFGQSRIEPSPDVEFFRNGIFENDYVFLITHGSYEFDENEYVDNPYYRGLHWLYTSEEVPLDSENEIPSKELAKLKEKYDISEVSIGRIKEKRNGETVIVGYKKVSNQFIASSNKTFPHPGKAIVFNTACQSMEGPNRDIYDADSINYTLSTAFWRNGAGIYLGYDETNAHGKLTGLQFYYNLLSGMSIQSACDNLQFDNLHEYGYNKDSESWYWADLIQHCPQQDFYNTCIIRPSIQFDDNSTESELSINLHANSYFRSYNVDYTSDRIIDSYSLSSDILSYGFELSESEQFTDALKLGEKQIGDENCHLEENNSLVDYSQSLTYSVGQADSKIMPNTTYWARAYVYDGQGYNYSEPITFTTGSIAGDTQNHEWVDLGLPSGTLWATCNVGANSPEEYGDYFAWGETEPNSYYEWDTYKWCNGSHTTMTKYCTDSDYGYNGFVDNKTELDPEDDAAYVNWGPSWRMPTTEQQRELFKKCSPTWTTQNGVKGRLFTGPNGNTLFLPAAGRRWGGSLSDVGSDGYYWSRTLYSYRPDYAHFLYFSSGNWGGWDVNSRPDGFTVRAVRVSQN